MSRRSWSAPDPSKGRVACALFAPVCGAACPVRGPPRASFGRSGYLALSATSPSPSQGVSQASNSSACSSASAAGGSWDALALVPEQLRWVMALPPEGRGRGIEAAERQLRDVGACEHPIWLRGRSLLVALA